MYADLFLEHINHYSPVLRSLHIYAARCGVVRFLLHVFPAVFSKLKKIFLNYYNTPQYISTPIIPLHAI